MEIKFATNDYKSEEKKRDINDCATPFKKQQMKEYIEKYYDRQPQEQSNSAFDEVKSAAKSVVKNIGNGIDIVLQEAQELFDDLTQPDEIEETKDDKNFEKMISASK